ncbi:acetyl-coenzyme A transporter 1 [Tetranychus urticae]|uniref:Acetyl-coenzyme A transporter 1 n=1 Tax=Tetranychus urticae TaxID=32264 RepID=T1JZ35_TETUR|nr:acetyl-coenzyme A transporter 1 [Tetranychus urticae]
MNHVSKEGLRRHKSTFDKKSDPRLINAEKGDSDHKSMSFNTSLSGDYGSIFILLVLYILQGIPLGLAGSIPLLLQNYKVSYSQQAIFSLCTWPFSLKLLWAPLVDSMYNKRFGRRKSWLIPTQYLIGLTLFLLSYKIDDLLGPLPKDQTGQSTPESTIIPGSPHVYILACVFFFLNFLCATQDIAVDGWALTMLSKRNVVYGSTCNTVGQTIGFSLGYLVFLGLESPEVCNKYLRSIPSDTGMITLSGFLYFWSIIFLITTSLVWLFKSEKMEKSKQATEETVLGTYLMLLKILKLKSIRSFAIILLTCKLAFAITDSGTPLKLTEAGISKETLAFLSVPLIPLQIILPWYLSKYTKGPKPLKIFIKSYPYRLICGIISALLLYWTKQVHDPVTKSFPSYYYVIVLVASGLHQVTIYCCYVALLSFHSRISDPSIGGTYMTLLNTITNLGGNWPSFISLWLLDYSTIKSCSVDGFSCNGKDAASSCAAAGGQCVTIVDGYYIEVIILTLIGFVWLKWARKRIERIESLPAYNWRCT